MDMTRYEKITGVDVVNHLLSGKHIFNSRGLEYHCEEGMLWSCGDGLCGTVRTPFNELTSRDWYIKKPFDVRQAMRDKPDEWVGAYEMNSFWYKVGFDTKNFMAVDTRVFTDVPTSFALGEVDQALSSELDACIPLDEVPADAR